MPAITITPKATGFAMDYYAPWQWVVHHGHPQQFYGEPYPGAMWVLERAIELYEYRKAEQWKQADAVRQWLRDYGMLIEQREQGGLTVKW